MIRCRRYGGKQPSGHCPRSFPPAKGVCVGDLSKMGSVYSTGEEPVAEDVNVNAGGAVPPAVGRKVKAIYRDASGKTMRDPPDLSRYPVTPFFHPFEKLRVKDVKATFLDWRETLGGEHYGLSRTEYVSLITAHSRTKESVGISQFEVFTGRSGSTLACVLDILCAMSLLCKDSLERKVRVAAYINSPPARTFACLRPPRNAS